MRRVTSEKLDGTIRLINCPQVSADSAPSIFHEKTQRCFAMPERNFISCVLSISGAFFARVHRLSPPHELLPPCVDLHLATLRFGRNYRWIFFYSLHNKRVDRQTESWKLYAFPRRSVISYLRVTNLLDTTNLVEHAKCCSRGRCLPIWRSIKCQRASR